MKTPRWEQKSCLKVWAQIWKNPAQSRRAGSYFLYLAYRRDAVPETAAAPGSPTMDKRRSDVTHISTLQTPSWVLG